MSRGSVSGGRGVQGQCNSQPEFIGLPMQSAVMISRSSYVY